MSLGLPFGIKLTNPLPVDRYYEDNGVPYTDVTDANSKVAEAIRYLGLTVNINNDEYWYKSLTTDIGLVLKHDFVTVSASNQYEVAVFNATASQIEGTAGLTWDGSILNVNGTIKVDNIVEYTTGGGGVGVTIEGVLLKDNGVTAGAAWTPTADQDLVTKLYVSDYVPYTGATANVDLGLFDITATTITGDGTAITNIQEDNVIVSHTVAASTYETLEDYIDLLGSSGKTTGGAFTNIGDGTLKVGAGTGMIRATNSGTAELLFFDWAEVNIDDLPDNSVSYIHLDYNSGTPIIDHETSSSANNRNIIVLGKVFRDGLDVHLFDAGMYIAEATRNILARFVQTNGEVTHASGGAISEVGTLQLASTAGVVWGGLTRFITPLQNTATGGHTFTYYYYDGVAGAWVESAETTINASQYDDIAIAGLANLSYNRYGIHWVYICADGDLLVVYGQDSYKLTEAQDAQPPVDLPEHVSEFSFLAAKVIVERNDTVFTDIESAYDISFVSAVSSVHNELSGLQGDVADEYYHLSSAQFVIATDVGLTNLAGVAMAADKFYYTSADNVHVAATVTSYARSILDDTDASTARTTLELAIGTDVLAYDAGLQNLAGVAMIADRFYYTSADNVHVAAPVTTFARSILDDADASTVRTTLGLEMYEIEEDTKVAIDAKNDSGFAFDNDYFYAYTTDKWKRVALSLIT